MVFDLFDVDKNRSLNDPEVKHMITSIYGQKGLQHDLNKLMKTINRESPALVERKEFVDACLKNPVLIFPAGHLQKVLQDKIGGVQFWTNQLSKSEE